MAVAGLMALASCSSPPPVVGQPVWGEVEVTVTTSGRPLADVEVQVWRDWDIISLHEQPLGTLTTNTLGFARAVVRADSVRVVARKHGFVEHGVTVRPDGRRVAVALELAPEELVSGRVIDTRGRPIASVQVVASRKWNCAWAKTDAEGRFVLEGLGKGHYGLEVWANSQTFRVEVDAPAEDVILRVSPEEDRPK